MTDNDWKADLGILARGLVDGMEVLGYTVKHESSGSIHTVIAEKGDDYYFEYHSVYPEIAVSIVHGFVIREEKDSA